MNVTKKEYRSGRQIEKVTTIEVDESNAYIRIVRYYDGEETETINWHRAEDGYRLTWGRDFDELMARA